MLATLLGTLLLFTYKCLRLLMRAAVVQTLIATSALMSLGVSGYLERATKATIVWSAVALVGVAILVSFGSPTH